MAIDRDVLDAVGEMDEHDLRRLLMFAKARLEGLGVEFAGAAPRVRLRSRMVKCGKDGCRSCPHGPYWYAHWTEEGRRRSRYVGKLPEEPVNPWARAAEGPVTD